MQPNIKETYWNEQAGYYNNDAYDDSFSSDWLIGYVTGFIDLEDEVDRLRTERTVEYIAANGLAEPLPIKYQNGTPKDAPWAIRTFVPNYGGDATWSYLGAEYITLLINLAEAADRPELLEQAREDITSYNEAIVRDGGFPETFNTDGQFLQNGIYKSIRITGWVVQFEHAMYEYEQAILRLAAEDERGAAR